MAAVEVMNPALLDRALNTLTRAFDADPMFRWIFPDPQERARSLRVLNRVPLRFGLSHGRVTQSHDGMAVAIWIPPGQAVSLGGMVRSGMLTVPLRVGLRQFGRFVGANDVMGKIHARHVPELHWYLMVVGVDPELQGRGVGSALVQEGLSKADENNSVCYLETSEERNVPFYQRYGFTVLEQAPLGANGPPGWAMRRQPRRAN
ncbi:GNAT family N-acetyltransferase [soil metagenome]